MERIAVIGGGIAGLSAGIYAARNGFDAIVLEQHRVPGGLCTGWRRRGASGRFTMEGCIHYVLGLTPGSPFHRMWDELGVDRPVVPVDELFTLRHPGGATLPVCADVEELARRMRAIAPYDAKAIDRLVSDVRLFARYDIPVDTPAERPQWNKLRSLGRRYPAFLARFLRCRFTSARAYARRFRDPLLRWAVARLSGYPDYPAVWMLMVLSRMHRGEAGYPMGGSLELCYDLEERLLQVGGTIRYGARVVGLRAAGPGGRDGAAPRSTRGRRVTGVLLADGDMVDCDYLVAAGDLRASLEWMRDAGMASRANELMLAALRPGHAVAQVSLGIRNGCAHHGIARTLDADAADSIVLYPRHHDDGAPAHRVVVRQYRRDDSLAPEGCRVVTCQIETDFDWWAPLAADSDAYRRAKRDLAARVIATLDRAWPGIAGCIEVTDVATPLTTERYTANHCGSVHGTRPDRVGFAWPAAARGPRGSHVYFAGHWLCPGGGIHRAAQSGRYAIQRICASRGQAFAATGLRDDARSRAADALHRAGQSVG